MTSKCVISLDLPEDIVAPLRDQFDLQTWSGSSVDQAWIQTCLWFMKLARPMSTRPAMLLQNKEAHEILGQWMACYFPHISCCHES